MTILSPGGQEICYTWTPLFILHAGPVVAGTTQPFILKAVDLFHQYVPDTIFQTLTLTIVNLSTNQVVNGVNDVDILNADRGVFDDKGNLTITLEVNDTIVASYPVHQALVLHYTYNLGGTSIGAVQVNFLVLSLSPLSEC
jgi:hypothetical protein